MKVSEFMTSDVRTAPQAESIQEAAQLMRDQQVGFLPIVNLAGIPMGVITDRDLAVRVVADGLPLNRPVCDIMSDHIFRVTEDTEIEDAVALMREKRVGRLVVTNDREQVVGVFSLGDAAVALGDHVIGNVVMEVISRHSHAPTMHPPVLL